MIEDSNLSRVAARQFFRDALETILLALVLFASIRSLVRNFWIEGSSMEPSLYQGQYLLVTKFSYWFKPPKRGDVVVFRSPISPERDLIKRVVGLGGEMIEIYDAKVFVNGTALDEPYARDIPYQGGPWILTRDQVFVLGDNRAYSQDSHNWGPLPTRHIIGKTWVCYWPIFMWGTMPHYSY